MAEQEEQTYKLIKSDGTVTVTSRDYSGIGFAEYSNQDTYEGNFENGIRQGKGRYTYQNGDKYDGEFINNKKHGIGKLTYKIEIDEETNLPKGGGEYYGHWENGKKHGEGIFTYLNKDVYSGWWKYGVKEGKGTYIYHETQMRLIGEWIQNKIAQGKWIFPNGMIYEGGFKENKPNGKGKWYFKNGNLQEGQFIQKQNLDDENAEASDEKKPSLQWVSDSQFYEASKALNKVENILN